MKPKIKICGLFRPCDIEFVNEVSPDYAGFVFAACRRRVLPNLARRLRDRLDGSIPAVGVFVNHSIDDIRRLTADGIVQIVQLHGQEDAAYIADLKSVCSAPIIKAIRVECLEDIVAADRWPTDFVLFDNGPGGTGRSFDWSLLAAATRPFFLAGGVSVQNVPLALKKQPFALDVSSAVETEGVKDRNKIQEFVARVRLAGDCPQNELIAAN